MSDSTPTPAAPTPQPPAPTASTAPLDKELDALLAERTVDEAVDALLKALGYDKRDVAQVTIRSTGALQVHLIDRSMRGVPINEWPRWRRDRDGFIIRDEDAR